MNESTHLGASILLTQRARFPSGKACPFIEEDSLVRNVYRYTIDLDERGELRSHVDQVFPDRDETIVEYDTDDLTGLQEDGFLRDPRDSSDIQNYLEEAGVIPPSSLMLAGHEDDPDWEALESAA